MMFVVYVGNIFQAILLYMVSINFCNTINIRLGGEYFTYCYKYDAFPGALIVLTVISWVILILSTWNSIRCHKNFGKGLEHYSM
jgi:hypothetical protein